MVGYTPQNSTNIHTNKPVRQEKNKKMSVETTELPDFLQELFLRFDPITLEEMDKVKLMNRVDTKFLICADVLPTLLQKAVDHYRIVEIDGLRASPYSSIYFDTEDAQMYTMHHNGKLNRYKVRMRTYVSSGDSYLEVKKKNNKGRTSKKRIRITNEQFQDVALDEAAQTFIQEKSPYNYSVLRPSLQNFFYRITLVDKNETERVTMDVGLRFRKVGIEKYTMVDNLVIVEMKQDGAARSYFRQYLNELSILPKGMSKYCLGMILTDEDIKTNRFKKKIRYINKLTKNNISY